MTDRKLQDSEKGTSVLDRFLKMVRETGSRRPRSSLGFYTRSALPALLSIQSGLKQEQL